MTDRPAIKPLEWTCSPEWKPGEFVGEWFVYSVAGHYRLWHDDTVTPAVWHVGYPVGSEQPYEGTEHPNIEEAKAAAQSDFASRIRSCLLDKPEAVGLKPFAWYTVDKHGCDYMSRDEHNLRNIAADVHGEVTPLYTRPAATDAALDKPEAVEGGDIDRLIMEFAEASYNLGRSHKFAQQPERDECQRTEAALRKYIRALSTPADTDAALTKEPTHE